MSYLSQNNFRIYKVPTVVQWIREDAMPHILLVKQLAISFGENNFLDNVNCLKTGTLYFFIKFILKLNLHITFNIAQTTLKTTEIIFYLKN